MKVAQKTLSIQTTACMFLLGC